MSAPRVSRKLRRASLPIAIAASVALAGIGCENPLDVGALPAPTFVAIPDTVAPGDTFAVVFTLRNPTQFRARVGVTCHLFYPEIFREEEPMAPVVGVGGYACVSPRIIEIAAQDSVMETDQIVAALPGPDGLTPFPAGVYRIRARMEIALPDLETVLTVVDSAEGTCCRRCITRTR
jgi:hypothetical protein